jgi:hypothetical protein
MNKPSNKLYGVTHDPETGEARVVEPRTTKVGIGLPKGKAIHVYIDIESKWVVQSGLGKNVKRERFDEKIEAQKYYRKIYPSAPTRDFPQRIPYFTFLRLSSNGDMEPDWDVIEDHGPVPTEIDIIFLRDDPFNASYQWWSASRQNCFGDGKIAMRSIAVATDEEKVLAETAKACGEKYFPVDRCRLAGCPQAQPVRDKPSACRPMGTLVFQLINSPRLGSSATFNTSGYKSIHQLFSAIEVIKRTSGSGDSEKGFIAGIPLKIVVRPYRIQYDGKTATQYAVTLEFRAASALALRRELIEEGLRFRRAGTEQLQLDEGTHNDLTQAVDLEPPEGHPAAIAAEFCADPDPVPESSFDDVPAISDDDFLDGPKGALEHVWDQVAQQAAAAPRPTDAQIRSFYHICRTKGMTDSFITNQLGKYGFESETDITLDAFPELMRWAEAYSPAGQGSLL